MRFTPQDEEFREQVRGWQRLFLFGKAETIYGGSDEIQLNLIASRALGLPSEKLPS